MKRLLFLAVLMVMAFMSMAAAEEYRTYVVQPGDTWAKIAAESNIPMDDLVRINTRTLKDKLFVGEGILIPVSRSELAEVREDVEDKVGAVVKEETGKLSGRLDQIEEKISDSAPFKPNKALIALLVFSVIIFLLLTLYVRQKIIKAATPEVKTGVNVKITIGRKEYLYFPQTNGKKEFVTPGGYAYTTLGHFRQKLKRELRDLDVVKKEIDANRLVVFLNREIKASRQIKRARR